MITLLITLLAHIITILGIGALAAMVLYVGRLTLAWVWNKARNFLSKKVGGTVTVMATQKLVQEIVREKQRNNAVVGLDELEAELKQTGVMDKDGVVIIGSDKDGKVDRNDIQIVTTDTLDENLKGKLDNAKDGVLVIGATKVAG